MNSGGGGGPPASGRHEFDCLKFTFDTSLELVAEAPVHAEHTVLEVFRQDVEDGPRVVAIDDDGQVIGRIRSHVGTLLECMDQGIAFVAVVKAVTLLVHDVTIRASSITIATRSNYHINKGNPGDSHALDISDRKDPEAPLTSGESVLEPLAICELRSLVRAGVALIGTVESVDTLDVAAL